MEKQEIAQKALQIAMEHRVEKVHLPFSIRMEEKIQHALFLMRIAVLSMYAFIAFGHCPRDLMIMKAAGQKEAFTQMTQLLCFLADFLRDSADLTSLMSALEEELGGAYMEPCKRFLNIERVVRRIDSDFMPGRFRMDQMRISTRSPIGVGALCTSLGDKHASKELNASLARYATTAFRLSQFYKIVALCFDEWGNVWLLKMKTGRFIDQTECDVFHFVLRNFAVVFHLWPELEGYVRARMIDHNTDVFDDLFNDQIRSYAREFADLHR